MSLGPYRLHFHDKQRTVRPTVLIVPQAGGTPKRSIAWCWGSGDSQGGRELVRAQNCHWARCAGASTHSLAGIEGLKTWSSNNCYQYATMRPRQAHRMRVVQCSLRLSSKVRQTAGVTGASRILASLGRLAKLLERGPTTMDRRSAPCDLAKSPRRHSGASLTVSTTTCGLAGREICCKSCEGCSPIARGSLNAGILDLTHLQGLAHAEVIKATSYLQH